MDANQTSLQPLKVRKNVPALQLPADNYLPSFIILGTWKTDFAISTKLISSSSAICPRPAAGRTSGFQTRFQGDLYQLFPLTSIRLGGFLSVPLHSCPPALLRNT
jgi:hypothetical protein